jgi:hypothetical protein
LSLASQQPFSLLRQLQYLPSERLDRLVEGWLRSLGFHSVRLWERRGTISTYEARFGDAPLALPARVRIHQRLRHLEISHVESFLGHLVRSGNPLGILVTPGECSWAAGLSARTPKLPFLRLCGGAEWAEELRAARLREKHERPKEPIPDLPEEEPPLMLPAPRPVDSRPTVRAAAERRTRDPRPQGTPEVPCETCRGQWHGGYRLW